MSEKRYCGECNTSLDRAHRPGCQQRYPSYTAHEMPEWLRLYNPDPTPDEQALAEIFWDGSGESIGWCEAFKYARTIIAAGWVRPPTIDKRQLAERPSRINDAVDNLHAPLTAIEVRPKRQQ